MDVGTRTPSLRPSLPPHAPSLVPSNDALRRGVAPVGAAQRGRPGGNAEQGFVGIGVKTKLSALTHSSLMFIDEETGGSEQGIVSRSEEHTSELQSQR